VKRLEGRVDQAEVERICADPVFERVTKSRSVWRWSLTAAMLTIYFGYVLAIAYDPILVIGRKATPDAHLLIVPLLMIFAPVALTGLYVFKANASFDGLAASMVKRES